MKKVFTLLLTIVMLVSMTSIIAGAEEAPKKAFIRLAGVEDNGSPKELALIIDEGGPAKYLLTDENGAATLDGATEDNYNVKFEYPTGGPATLYLKGANLKTNNNFAAVQVGTPNWFSPTIKDFDLKIITESDSTLTGCQHATLNAGYCAIDFSSTGSLTITGPGKLSLYTESMCCISSSGGGEVIIQDANVYGEVQVKADFRPAIWVQKNNLTIDNSKVELNSGEGGPCLYISDALYEFSGEPNDIIIKNGSEVKLVNDSYQPVIKSTGEFKVDSSNVEVIAKGTCFFAAPKLEGVGALAGTKISNAKAYNEKKAKSYAYFKCGPDVVAETEPPATTAPTTQPTEATKPVETQPAVTQPAATQPAATQPAATQPAATQPAATQPAATQPAATQPAATKPAGNNTTGSSGNGRLITFVIIGIVMLAGIGSVAFMMLQTKKAIANTESNDVAEPTEDTDIEGEE